MSQNTNPEMLADILTQNSRFDFTIYAVDSEAAILEALRFGNADIALMDSGAAWIGWNQYGLQALRLTKNQTAGHTTILSRLGSRR